MSTSFWKAEGKIPIEQTSKAVAVLNGLNFSGGQELRIKVPPTTKFIKPDECYLQGDFKIGMDTSGSGVYPTLLQLDERLGGQSIIKEISIFSSAEKGSVLLEQITNYNSMVSVMRDYDTNDSEKRKRAMTEGATIWIPQTRGTLGSTRSEASNCTATNPYFKQTSNGSGNKVGTAFGDSDFTTCKLCLPLETGIFRNDKVWVNMLTGLEIVIILEDADKCVRALDSTLRQRRLALNPRFHSTNGSTVPDDWVSGSATDRFYIEKTNSNLTPATCPFVVGEKLNFVSPDNATVGAFDAHLVVKEVNSSATANGGAGLLEIVLTAVCTSAQTVGKGAWFVYSDSITSSAGLYTPTYSFSNVELVVQEVDMGSSYVSDVMSSMKEKGVIVHDILSAQNYRYSQNQLDTVANIRLPLVNARGKSIICIPTDSTTYSSKVRLACNGTYAISSTPDITLSSADQFRGVSNNLVDFQFIYDGRLQPSRPVRCSKTSSDTSIDAQPLIETTKALVQAEISANSLECFNKNFVVSRALALNKGVYDTRNKDFNLQVNYTGTSGLSVPQLWNNYVFHLRRINIRGNSIDVEV
tara:strand:- start:15836 stop:17584 length:1749 start_codon:yes stop_codon:yes gene_type:complete